MSKFAIPASEATLSGRSTTLVGRGKEINASSKQDLIKTIATLMQEVQAGSIELAEAKVTVADKQAAKEAIMAAMADNSGSQWRALGSQIATTIQEQTNREGFMRRFLVETPIAQGDVARIRMNVKNARAVYQSSASGVLTQLVRDKYFMAPEFYIDANLEIEELELAQSSSDMLSEKYFEGLEAIMAGEDRRAKALFDEAVALPTANAAVTLTSAYSPTNHAELINTVNSNGLSADTILMANDIIVDITGNTSFGSWFDPVSRLEIVRTGMVGVLNGLNIVTDAYRRENLKVLNKGEIYVIGKPEQVGAFTTRGEVQSQERNGGIQANGRPTRGWYLMEMMSMVVANPKAIAKATRV